MGRIRSVAHAFNMGEVDVDNLARIDIDRMRLAAEVQENIIGTISGKAFLRPGMRYLGSVPGPVMLKEFIYSADDAALLEFSNGALRVYVNDELVSRADVSTAITSGEFSSLTGWTDISTSGATATITSGQLDLSCSATGATAGVRQQVTVAAGDVGVEHALKIVVTRGPVSFMCGPSAGSDDYIGLSQLEDGTHSLAFTPSGSFWVQFQSDLEPSKLVTSITVETPGVMSLPTPFATADLPALSFDQSGDVVYIAWAGHQRLIERRSARSWSLVEYKVNDGPFYASRTDTAVKLKPSVTRGNGALTSSKPFFTRNHVGALFYLFHEGQNIVQKLYGEQSFTGPIKVTGISGDRDFTYTIAGTWSGTIWRQRSYDDANYGFHDAISHTSNATVSYNDTLDNSVIWYRLGFKPGGYTSGVAEITINYDGGGDYGICRVVGYNSRTSVDIEILRPFKATTYTSDWREGMWSDAQGWPSGVALAEGRLFWAGDDKWWGSVSDAYKSFDEQLEGDSGPINRSIAVGSVNAVKWMTAVRRLVIGTNGAEVVASSSSLDEPLTPSNSTIKAASTIGSSSVSPAKVDSKILFVDRSATALFEMVFGQSYEYQSTEISRLRARLFAVGIKQLAVQRRPETRIWVVLNDGTAVCFLYEPSQEVAGFFTVKTQGLFESVAVLPESGADRVYFSVQRQINGSTVRFIEKMSVDSAAKPSARSSVGDAFGYGVNISPTTTLNVGTHLTGAYVKVWADGAPINETVNGIKRPRLFLVDASGNITLDDPVTNWLAGLPFTGRFKSARLAYGAQGGTSLLATQRVSQLGILLCDYVRSGVKYGKDFETLFPLREQVNSIDVDDVSIGSVQDEKQFIIGGDGWTLDRRMCLQFEWPASVLALVYDVDSNG
ncbi:MAG: hypothetical protein DI589_12020 [Shinella sp.]|nr:MAG: hypothetical protein DI589_12020 [Shinella sp.]